MCTFLSRVLPRFLPEGQQHTSLRVSTGSSRLVKSLISEKLQLASFLAIYPLEGRVVKCLNSMLRSILLHSAFNEWVCNG